MGTHSSILAWRSPRTEESGGLQSMGLQKSQTLLSTIQTRWNGGDRLSPKEIRSWNEWNAVHTSSHYTITMSLTATVSA